MLVYYLILFTYIRKLYRYRTYSQDLALVTSLYNHTLSHVILSVNLYYIQYCLIEFCDDSYGIFLNRPIVLGEGTHTAISRPVSSYQPFGQESKDEGPPPPQKVSH